MSLKKTTNQENGRKDDTLHDDSSFLIDKLGINFQERSGTGLVVNILKNSSEPISISDITLKMERINPENRPKVGNIEKRVKEVVSWLTSEGLISIKNDKIILLKGKLNGIHDKHFPTSSGGHDANDVNLFNLSSDAKKIFHMLPSDGSKIGNTVLKRQLKISNKSYLNGKEELKKAGLIVTGRGRGGAIGRAKREKLIYEKKAKDNALSSLPIYARKLYRALPSDGTKVAPILLKSRLKLSDELYVKARDELKNAGLIVTGHGLGRVKPKKPDNTMTSNLSSDAKKLYRALPSDGTKMKVADLKYKSELYSKSYLAGIEELKKAGLIVIDQARGGGVGRTKLKESANSFLEERAKILNDLVDPQKQSLETQMAPMSEDSFETELDTEELSFDDIDIDDDIEDISSQERQIFSDKSDPSVLDLYGRFKDGELILQPDFQRQFIWDYKKCSRLIESAILEVPLPMIYLAEEHDGCEAVIDGQQRLSAFFKYLDGDYSLRGIKVLKELRRKYFVDLDRLTQSAIKRCSIRTTVIKKESSESLRFEIFERLNTGAVSLNDQELRNCIYRGPYNLLLKELSQDPDFKYLIGITKLEKRMRDVELVLRFAAFYHTSYLHYSQPMRKFLNDDMMRYQYISEDEKNELKKAFKNSLHILRSLFDKHAFRRFYRGTFENANGYWEPIKFSASLYDVLMYTFAKEDKHLVYQHLDAVREAIIHCMTEDDDFIETIERGTSNKVMIVRRFDKLRLKLKAILVDDFYEPRCFSLEIKNKLFDNDQTCAICNQKIHSIDDAAVDHIKQYWRGGRTIPENARLTHRFCNWSRSRKE